MQRVACAPAHLREAPWAAELRLSPDAQWLAATERRSSTISVFAVDANGHLALRAQEPVEAQPRGMQWSPDGRNVLVAGQSSHQLASLRWDADRGALTQRDRAAAPLNPNWIETLTLGA